MNVFRYDNVKAEDVVTEGAFKVKVRWLITKEMGANNFAMRVFEVDPEGYTPLHSHSWEHEIFVLDGTGELFDGEKVTLFKAGDVVFVPSNERHQFKNNGTLLLRFICLIPYTRK